MSYEEFKRDYWHLQTFKQDLSPQNKPKSVKENPKKKDPSLAEEYRIIELTEKYMAMSPSLFSPKKEIEAKSGITVNEIIDDFESSESEKGFFNRLIGDIKGLRAGESS